VVVFQNVGTCRYQRLTGIVGRHLHSARFEPPLKFREDLIVEDQLPMEDTSNNFPSDVVFCRPEASDCNENGRAGERPTNGIFEIVLVVTHNGFHYNGNSYGIELLGQIERVCISELWCQQLRTNRDDFRREHDYGRGFPMMPRRTRYSELESTTIKFSFK